jgi:hypothetical protein
MHVDPANASELATIAREVGGEILEEALHYPSETGSWQLGDVDLDEYLDRYHDRRLIIAFMPNGKAEKETVTCDICDFAMDEVGKCPGCKLILECTTEAIDSRVQEC